MKENFVNFMTSSVRFTGDFNLPMWGLLLIVAAIVIEAAILIAVLAIKRVSPLEKKTARNIVRDVQLKYDLAPPSPDLSLPQVCLGEGLPEPFDYDPEDADTAVPELTEEGEEELLLDEKKLLEQPEESRVIDVPEELSDQIPQPVASDQSQPLLEAPPEPTDPIVEEIAPALDAEETALPESEPTAELPPQPIVERVESDIASAPVAEPLADVRNIQPYLSDPARTQQIAAVIPAVAQPTFSGPIRIVIAPAEGYRRETVSQPQLPPMPMYYPTPFYMPSQGYGYPPQYASQVTPPTPAAQTPAATSPQPASQTDRPYDAPQREPIVVPQPTSSREETPSTPKRAVTVAPSRRPSKNVPKLSEAKLSAAQKDTVTADVALDLTAKCVSNTQVVNNLTIIKLFGDKIEPAHGKYVVYRDEANPARPFRFRLLANNGQVLFNSEGYKIRPRARQIETFRKAVIGGGFTYDHDKNDNFQFKLFTPDGKLFGVGESYRSLESAENAAKSVVTFAQSANYIEDDTVPAEIV